MTTMMDSEAYARALEQRGAQRRQINKRLAELRAARHALQADAGNIPAGPPTLVMGPDPLAQVGPLLSESAQLSAQLRRNAEQVATLEKDLIAARDRARAILMRTVGIGVALLAALALYFLFKH
jgi:site-specific recombinase XerC